MSGDKNANGRLVQRISGMRRVIDCRLLEHLNKKWAQCLIGVCESIRFKIGLQVTRVSKIGTGK